MIKYLSKQTLVHLLLLVVANFVIGIGYLYWLQPLRSEISQTLDIKKSEVTSRYQEVSKMKEEFVLLQSQLRYFKELEFRGFFNDQNRSAAIDSITKLSDLAGLLKAGLKFGKGEIQNDPMAEAANQVMLKSPVTVSINSLDDVDVYTFIKFLQEDFAGNVDLKSVKLDRMELLNVAMLRKIGSGDPSPLVSAEVSFDWLTMASKDIVAPVEGGN